MEYFEQLLASGFSEILESVVKKDPVVNNVFARTSNESETDQDQVVDDVFARNSNGLQCAHGEDLIINDYIRNASIG